MIYVGENSYSAILFSRLPYIWHTAVLHNTKSIQDHRYTEHSWLLVYTGNVHGWLLVYTGDSITHTLGSEQEFVIYVQVSTTLRIFHECTNLSWPTKTVCYGEVSAISGVPYNRFHCIEAIAAIHTGKYVAVYTYAKHMTKINTEQCSNHSIV